MSNLHILTIGDTFGAADDDGISLSQTPLSAGNLTVTGAFATDGVATLDIPRRVLITCAGADSGRTFTVYGTNKAGDSISESIAGSATSTTQSLLDFKTVTRVAVDAATAGAVKVGTSTAASTDWIDLQLRGMEKYFAAGLSVELSSGASLNYTVQYRFAKSSEINHDTTPPVVFNHDDSNLVSATSSKSGNFIIPVSAVRLVLNSRSSGTATLKVLQSGVSK